MRIITVPQSSRRDVLKFIKFPIELYRESEYFVPHLIFERKQFFHPLKNPFFEHAEVELYLAISGSGDIVGRASAHIDYSFQEHGGEGTGFFGFFDSVNDQEVARGLTEKVMEFHRKRGMKRVIGPMNFNTNDEVGLLIEGFDSIPFIMMPYNFPYYGALMEGCGFVKEKDLYAYYGEYSGATPEFILKVSGRAKRSTGVSVRCLNMSKFDEELKLVKEIYNSAWSDNWGFIPMTDREIEYMASNLKPIIDPSLIYFASVGDREVGFFLAVPDYNQILAGLRGRLFPAGIIKLLLGKKKINRMRVLVMGVDREYRRAGLEAVMLEEIYRRGPACGYPRGEMSWILEDNLVMNRIISKLVGKPYKTYRIYGLEL